MNRLRNSFVMAATILFPGAWGVAEAAPIVYYSFNATNAIADVGSGISVFSNKNATGVSTSFFAGTTLNAQPGFDAGRAVAQSQWLGDTNWFQFTLDSTGFEDLILSFALDRSSTGPSNVVLQYSSAGVGGLFVDFVTNPLVSASFELFTNDVSTVTALDNNSEAVFRLLGLNASSSVGTLRVDNFTIDATVIHEPSTFLLVAIGILSLLVFRRRS